MKKTKVLLVGWNKKEQERMEKSELTRLSKKFELIFVSTPKLALHEIAKAKLLEKNPIRCLVFERQTLVEQTKECKLVSSFGYDNSGSFIIINMRWHENDHAVKQAAVTIDFCKEGEWNTLQELILKECKQQGWV
jgi:hypothetical protein